MNLPTEPTISVEEAAGVLGVGRATAYRLVATGDIPSIRLGLRLIRVPTQQLLDKFQLSSKHEESNA